MDKICEFIICPQHTDKMGVILASAIVPQNPVAKNDYSYHKKRTYTHVGRISTLSASLQPTENAEFISLVAPPGEGARRKRN